MKMLLPDLTNLIASAAVVIFSLYFSFQSKSNISCFIRSFSHPSPRRAGVEPRQDREPRDFINHRFYPASPLAVPRRADFHGFLFSV